MKKRFALKIAIAVSALVAGGGLVLAQFYTPAPDCGQLGGPIAGLTPEQLRLFYQSKELFKHDFTPEEGLGPVFNGRSCYECHGKPGVAGGEGKDITTTGVIRIGNRIGPLANRPLDEVISQLTQDDVDRMFSAGGPAIQRKSITAEFPEKYPPDVVVETDLVPPNTELISLRHTGPLFGLGLIEAIPDITLTNRMFQEKDMNQRLAGRLAVQNDPLVERLRIGRFGYKAQFPTIMLFNVEAMRTELGVTTYVMPYEKFAMVHRNYPPSLRKYLPAQPNDEGAKMLTLDYYQALLAPPPRGAITEQVKRGEAIFDKLQCSVCHAPVMYTAANVSLPDPRSPVPTVHWMEVKALENQPVRAYSDFLLHQMGRELADGLPQNGAKGGEWRTQPLWWLNTKKFYLHDGRASTIEDAILAHGGQAAEVKENFKKLASADREDLLKFLKSL